MIEEQYKWEVRIIRDKNGHHEIDGVRYRVEEKGSFPGKPEDRLGHISTAIEGFRRVTIPSGQTCFETGLEIALNDTTRDN